MSDLYIVPLDHSLRKRKEFKNFKKHQILIKRTTSDKVLLDQAINIDKNPKYERYQRSLVSMLYKFFDKESTTCEIESAAIHTETRINFNIDFENQQLAEELHKQIIIKF